MAVPSLAEPPDDCPDLLYRDDQRCRDVPKLDKMVGSIRSDLARYEKTREFLGDSEVGWCSCPTAPATLLSVVSSAVTIGPCGFA